jgi:tetratricopeptide (TPR) repeat protein
LSVLLKEEPISMPERVVSALPSQAKVPEVTEASSPEQEPKASHDESESKTLEAAMNALDQGLFAEAVELFEEVLAREPKMSERVTGLYTKALMGQAAALSHKAPKRAKPYLLKAVELDPRNVKGHLELGLLYTRLKEYPQAIGAYEIALELDPALPEAFFNLAYVHALTRDYARAEEMYAHVVKMAPSYLDEALFNLAMVQRKQGKTNQCIENLERATKYNPNNKLAKEYLLKLKGHQGESS